MNIDQFFHDLISSLIPTRIIKKHPLVVLYYYYNKIDFKAKYN